MALILRVDVDKPYGHHTLIRRIFSKLVEDYIPSYPIKFGYLSHLKHFIRYCNDNKISGTFFHRICTSPDEETLDLLIFGNHKIGLHLENSVNIKEFLKEVAALQKAVPQIAINCFSKHGSGIHKLGKYHYPKYEPELYRSWEKKTGHKFYSGNNIATCSEDLLAFDGFFSNIFWMEPAYRSPNFHKVEDLIAIAVDYDVVILIHPCNYISDVVTRKEFHKLVKLAVDKQIDWKHFE